MPISPNIELAELDAVHWANWFDLLVPPDLREAPSWALVTIDGQRVSHAVIAGRGAIAPQDVPFAATHETAMRELRKQLGVGLVIVLGKGAIADLLADIEGSLSLDDDYVEQCLTILRALKRTQARDIWVEPRVLDIIPAPPKRAIHRTFDLLFADRTSFAMYVFDEATAATQGATGGAAQAPSIYTSIITTKTKGTLDFATTHLALERQLPSESLARHWRANYKQILKAIAGNYERPCLGVFCTKQAIERILTGPPEQLTQEISRKQLILDPAPAWMLGLLGGAAVASVANKGAKALAALLPPSARKLAADFAGTANARLRSSANNPFKMLGFDPIELFFQLRRLYR